MLTDKTFSEVYEDFPQIEHNKGLTYDDLDFYLSLSGYAVRRLYKHKAASASIKWPVPFSDVHYALVTTPTDTYHFIVLLKDGSVLDPGYPERTRLTDYKDVWAIVGVHKIIV